MIETPDLAEVRATRLLADYDADSSFFFASPQRTILAHGAYMTIPCGRGADAHHHLSAQVADVLKTGCRSEHDVPLVVGAIPFDSTQPAHLLMPMSLTLAAPLRFATAAPEPRPLPPCEIRPVPAPADYKRGVEQALTHLKRGALAKVVLARSLQLTTPAPINVRQVLHRLAQRNPHGYTFAVDLPQRDAADTHPGAGVSHSYTLIGASPELLVSRSGMQVVTNPLAGSAARSDDPAEDQRRATALLSSAKDRHEHAVVVDAVAAALRPYCRRLDVPVSPSLIHTATMWHLSTRISGELADPATSALELAVALHPTPAVCGFPTERARTTIAAIEPFDRGFYTGMVGWCAANGDGEWVIALRCAEVADRAVRLFAGAGIVRESRPEDELAETSAKFRTMLAELGLDQHARTV